MGVKTLNFQCVASTSLSCFTGYHFSDQQSRQRSGSILFPSFYVKPCTATGIPMEVLENVAREHFWGRLRCYNCALAGRCVVSRIRSGDDGSGTAQTPSKQELTP